MANQFQVSHFKICTFRQIVPFIFPSDDKGRARSAEKFSMCNSFCLGIAQVKGRAQRGKIVKL